jgi:hypothetical protein
MQTMYTTKGLVQALIACLVVIMATACESELCKVAKTREANAVLEAQDAVKKHEYSKKNEAATKARIKKEFEEIGVFNYDIDGDFQAHYDKLLSKRVMAVGEANDAKALRREACR